MAIWSRLILFIDPLVSSWLPWNRTSAYEGELRVDRPTRFEENRYLGDKRSQVVYDLDDMADTSVVDELVASEQVATFGPDTLAELFHGYT